MTEFYNIAEAHNENALRDLKLLSSRPPWRVPRLLVRVALVMLTLSLLMIVFGSIWANSVYQTTSALESGENPMMLRSHNTSDLLIGLGMHAMSIGFYAGILWFISLIVDKVDQLVWMSASPEDKLHIYNTRVKKNAKNK